MTKIAVIFITSAGKELAHQICEHIQATRIFNYKDADIESIFSQYTALIYIMACGIAVRSIAPYIKNKVTDPAVLVTDEKGRFVISLLSGHIGGANALAQTVAGITGGTAVITTATDINNLEAFDLFAVENNCAIENLKDLKHISGALLNGDTVDMYTDYPLSGTADRISIKRYGDCPSGRFAVVLSHQPVELTCYDKILVLRPKIFILGLGCKRGISLESLQTAVDSFLHQNRINVNCIKCVASVEIKKDEQAIIDLCKHMGVAYKTISADRIKEVEHLFKCSEFVKNSIGVGSVAEACSVLAGKSASLLCPKQIFGGITVALAKEEKTFEFTSLRG